VPRKIARPLTGYGLLISRARDDVGMEIPELASRIGQSITTVRRLESEAVEPSVAQVNALTAALPISAEQLLLAMGVHLNPPAAAKLPRQIVEALLPLGPDDLLVIERVALGLQTSPASRFRPEAS